MNALRKLFEEIIFIVISFCLLFHSSCLWAQPPKISDLPRLRTMSREEIAKVIYHYASKDVCMDDLVELSSLLGNKEDTQATGDLSSKIQVRDVVLVCIEELTGESFLLPNMTYPAKAILLYKQNNDDRAWRFTIPTLSDEEFKQIQLRVDLWIDDFKKKSHKE